MAIFEIVLEGPPVSLNAKEHKNGRRRYSRWVRAIRDEALKAWPLDPTQNNFVVVTVTCYHTIAPPDVDNILKPICDGMKEVIYKDDKQIGKIVSQRRDLALPVEDPSEALAAVLGKWAEVVQICVTWNEEGKS